MADINNHDLDRVLEAWAEAKERGEEPEIDSLCEGDSSLATAARSQIRKLSAIEDALGLNESETDNDPPFGVGTKLGGYELIEYIGEGGFGVVFEAKRTDGLLGRFAVKVLSRSMYSPEARARFTNEGKALSMARHEHITSVIDAGVSDQGVPYLVMDFIEGQPLTEHCQSQDLDVAGRLGLFLQACAAVEHAHSKGVIHRDLKPANLLVQIDEDGPNLKVIDFGIARVMEDAEQSRKRFTLDGELIGTAAYMSPEQMGVGGSEPDTRSDIYSLGVVLYELVSGWLPYQRSSDEELTIYELQRRLRESRPTSVISRRKPITHTEQDTPVSPPPAATNAAGVGMIELNWIIMKCIAVEPERRYATCKELADDIRRLLEGRPVLAGPQSRGYLVRKFVERHRVGVASASALVLVTLVAAGLTSYGLISAAREGKRAIQAEEDTRQVAEFQAEQLASIDANTMGQSILEQVLESVDDASTDAGLTQEEALVARQRAEEALAGVAFSDVATHVIQETIFAPSIDAAAAQFEQQPEIMGRLLHSLGVAQTRIGLLGDGLQTHDTAIQVLEKQLGRSHQQTLDAVTEYANTLRALGRSEEAEPILREAIEAQRKLAGDTAISTLKMQNDYAVVLFNLGKVEEAARHLQPVANDAIRTLGESNNLTATIRGNLGDMLDQLGRSAEAEQHHRASLIANENKFGSRHQATIIARNNLAKCMVTQGKFEEALPELEQTVTLARIELGRQHPTTLLALSNLAITLQRTGNHDRALGINTELLETRSEVLGPEHPHTMISMNVQAGLLLKSGRAQESLELALKTISLAERLLGADRFETAIFRSTQAQALAATGQHEEAGQVFEEVHTTLEATIGTDNIYAQNNAKAALAMYTSQAEVPGEDAYEEEIALWQSRIADQVP